MLWLRQKSWQGYKFLLIFMAIAIVLAIASCHRNTYIQVATRSPIETKVVSHALGRVKIPFNPQRVIVLDDSFILEPVLALGVKPLGVLSCPSCSWESRGMPSDLMADVPDVGNRGEPSLEKILKLKPDLILGSSYQKSFYNLLSKIAPTVIFDPDAIYDFKERLRYYGRVLEKRDRAEKLLVEYQNRVRQLQYKLDKKLQTKTISVIAAASADAFYPQPSEMSIHGQVINEVGLRHSQQPERDPNIPLSLEILSEYDADILFVVTEFLDTRFQQANPESLSFLQNPLWSTLKAVKNRQVYAVNWNVGGIFGANRVIDDLFKYLVNTR